MAVDRRAFSLGGLAFILTAACSAGTPGQAVPGGPGGWWPLYRQRFLLPEGRIVDTGNGNVSHSEGQGYGMVLAAWAGDRDAFDAMAGWTRAILLRKDVALHSWRFDPSSPQPVADPNNATDGDVLIAWALMLAARKWNHAGYAEQAHAIRSAIRQRCVVERGGRLVLLPGLVGFSTSEALTFNPAYYVWPAFDLFAREDGKSVWGKVIADGEALVGLSAFGPHRLPTDWVDLTGPDACAPAPGKPARFGFDAVRVGLYAAMTNRLRLAGNVAAFWRGQLAQGKAIPAWIDVVTGEEAPYAISSGGAAIASRLTGTPSPTLLASDYYAASLQMLAV